MKTHPAYKMFGLESYIGTPLKLDEGLYGTLNFSSPRPSRRKFKDIDIDALQLMSSWLSTELSRLRYIEELKAANAQLQELANSDSLTNLHNRRSLQSHIEQYLHLAKRSGSPVSLIILDVDKFKDYNDSFGHIKGDQVLVQLAEILKKSCRSSDIAARFGGEEFAVLLPNTAKSGALHFATVFQNNLEGHKWSDRAITASFGIATTIYDKDYAVSVDKVCIQLIKEADSALYYSKQHGRNQANHFDDCQFGI
jgi:diguanylate cyclase (GGDEF)-like protein